MRYTLLYLLLIIFGGIATAVDAAASNTDGQSVRLEHFTVNQGLTQNTITGVVEDADGFLWIATGAGLNRFDGHHFHHIEGPEGVFTNRHISMLRLTDDGVLWLAIPNVGLFSLSPEAQNFEQRLGFELIDDWWFAEINHIFRHHDYYYFSNDTSVRRMHVETNELTDVYQVNQQSDNYYDIIRHAIAFDDYIVVATSKGLDAIHTETFAVTEIDYLNDPDAHFNQLNSKYLYVLDPYLYIATVQGLYRLPLQALEQALSAQDSRISLDTEVVAADLNVWQIQSHRHNLLMAAHTGFYQFDTQRDDFSNVLRFADSSVSVFDNSIHHLFIDSDRNIWLGTWFNGLFQWRPQTRVFETIARGVGSFPNLSSNQIWALAEDNDGRLWAGTQNGLNLLDTNSVPVRHEVFFATDDDSAYIHEGTVYNLYPDSVDADVLWLYQSDEMYRFDASSGERTILADLVTDATARELLSEYMWGYQLIDTKLWFANPQGLFSFDTQSLELNSYSEFDAPDFDLMNLYRIVGAAPHAPELIILALASEIWLFDTNTESLQRIYQHDPFQPYSDIYVESMVTDQQGRIWMTLLGHGILIFDQEFKLQQTLTTRTGLPTSDVYQGQLDDNGTLWFSSMNGLLAIDPDTFHSQRFTYRDGTSSNEFNLLASTKLQDGRLAYGSMRGITLFDPSDLSSKTTQLTPRISAISDITTGQRLPVPIRNLHRYQLRLDHDNRGIRVEVSTTSLDRPHEVRYHFELNGREQLSLQGVRDPSIALPRLRPGRYTLSVRAVNPSNGELTAPALLGIHVAYPTFSSPLAVTLYVIALAFLLFLLARYRMQQHAKLRDSMQSAKLSQERLQLAINATKSGIWDWHSADDLLFETRLSHDLGYSNHAAGVTLENYRDYIHRRDYPSLARQWQALLAGERDDIHCSYRMRHSDGHWLWFQDIGHVTARDADGVPERVTGVYQNITNARSTEEKALLFGKAFEQTQDWVLLLNAEQLPMTANRAFCQALGVDEEQIAHYGFNNLAPERIRFYREVVRNLRPGEQWRGEDIVSLASGRYVPVLINISAVADSQTQNHAFVIVVTDISSQKEAEEKLRQLANYDALTGLPNRALLTQRIDAVLSEGALHQQQTALIFMDLDRFKQINDSHGHNVGDKLLCIIGERMLSCVRSSDTVARLGGDEFIVLLTAADEQSVYQTATRILGAVNEPIIIDKHHIRISPSIGIALYPQHGRQRDELLKHADLAMYEAKAAGRNCYRVFKSAMDAKVRQRLNLETELKQAVAQHHVRNHYQPIVDARTQTCRGIELLMRWSINEQPISPETFIPLAEDLGLIVDMTEHAIHRGLADLVRLRRVSPELYLSVNLSVQHLGHTALPHYLNALLEQFELPASALKLEITEGVLIEETVRARRAMQQLNEIGVDLMLDDFGTGYSSLRYLKEFPIEVIKIDRSFTRDIGSSSADEAMIESILAMASNLNKACVAEGVELAAQRDWLMQRNCFLMQGDYFLPARNAQTVEAWLIALKRSGALSPG